MAQFQDSLDWQAPNPTRFSKQMECKFLGLHLAAWTSMSFPSPKHREVNQPKKDGIFTKSMVYTDWQSASFQGKCSSCNASTVSWIRECPFLLGFYIHLMSWISGGGPQWTMVENTHCFYMFSWSFNLDQWTSRDSGPWEIISSSGIQPDSRLKESLKPLIGESYDWNPKVEGETYSCDHDPTIATLVINHGRI